MTTVNIVAAAIVIFGVVYNSARFALAEQARELASMASAGVFAPRRVVYPAGRAGPSDPGHSSHQLWSGLWASPTC